MTSSARNIIERREDGSRYELGRGAMGVTYRAIDTSLQRTVALKIIQTDLAARSAEARERFMREARAAAALRDPNVATVYHFGIREETGQCFYAMELVEGETLDARVRRTGPLDVRTTVEIGRQIAAALGAAEKRGLVHRDLKPANVMIATTECADDVEESSDIHIKVVKLGLPDSRPHPSLPICKDHADEPAGIHSRLHIRNGHRGRTSELAYELLHRVFAKEEAFGHGAVTSVGARLQSRL